MSVDGVDWRGNDMQEIFRRHIGLHATSVREVAVIVQRKRFGTKERTVRAWLSGDMEPKASEFMALMKMLDDEFVNEVMNRIGYIAEPIEGFTTKEELGHGINDVLAGEYFDQPGNGHRRVKVLVRLRMLVGGYLSAIRQKRLAA